MVEFVQQKANKRRANPNKQSVNPQEGKTEESFKNNNQELIVLS